jgi:serine/threonine-protein kinase
VVVQQLAGGRYRLTERIATGGMGEVWRAVDEVLERPVAVKTLQAALLADDAFRERFRREARAAASINHPGVVRVHDFGEESDSAYLVMEYVEGRTLAAELRETGPFDAERTLRIIEQAAIALQAAHDHGVVHRDIKPGNLLIDSENDLKIADFGIAKVAAAVPITATGQLTGTAQYLSPEQARGESSTAATDIYSLGVVAYACLAGRPPFVDGAQVSIALAHVCEEPPPLPPTVPAGLRELVYAMLSKKPEDRPPSADAVARTAAALLGEAPTTRLDAVVPAPRQPIDRRLPAPRKRPRRAGFALGGAALLLLAILVAWSGFGWTTVPSMTGRQQQLARDAAAHANLRVTAVTADVPGIAAGIVAAQSIPAGTSVAANSTVRLTVASGRVRLPDLVGHSYDQAVSVLRQLKLSVARATKTTSATAAGSVVAVSASGSVPVNATVVLTVAVPPGGVQSGPVTPEKGSGDSHRGPSGNSGHGRGTGPTTGPTAGPTAPPSDEPTPPPTAEPSPVATQSP